MMTFHRLLLPLFAAAALLAGCASGPTFAEMDKALPVLKAGEGRIFFYRPSTALATSTPDLTINGGSRIDVPAQGFIFVDRPAGDYQVRVWGLDSPLNVPLADGQTQYVRILAVTKGMRLHLFAADLIPPEAARQELGALKYYEGERIRLIQ